VAPLEVDNTLITTPMSKAAALGDQFFSVFTRENNITPVISSSPNPPMSDITFTANGIEHLLKNLKPGKAAGPDDIPAWMLNICAVQVAPILQVFLPSHLTRAPCQTGDWLTANVILIYKKGNKSIPANYRPISLTAACCKVMEHIVFHSIMDHLNAHNIINPNQHGFGPSFSYNTQLILLVDDILRTTNSRYQVDLVLLDFSKAFDTVAHNK